MLYKPSLRIADGNHSSLAQSGEPLTVNQVVAGSSPAGGASLIDKAKSLKLVSNSAVRDWSTSKKGFN